MTRDVTRSDRLPQTLQATSAAPADVTPRPGLVLYIHPWGHLNDLVVPSGAITCMNAIAGPKLGRYAFEVSDDEIRAAAVVCADVHWALGLTGFDRLVAHVRAVAPRVPIVAGGITAALLGEALLAAWPIDYVLRGDAEESFAALVAALRAGRTPEALPNVLARGGQPAPPRRMSPAAFDATDPVTLDWFPTLGRATDLDAAAFPPGRTVIVARGCPLRCPTCYGSHAATYGRGYLWRSPARTAALLREAERAGARNVRLMVGKPSPRRLSEMIAAIGAAGPLRFGSATGLFLCRAPSDAELDALDGAFESPVSLSVVPPEEHVPPLGPERLAEERAAWRRVAERVARSRHLHLDVWATAGRPTAPLRAELGAAPERRVTVSSGAVWSMTRPSGEGPIDLARARAAVGALWTFYAARLLSPVLARLLAPFRFLDEVDDGLDDLRAPDDPALAPFHARVLASWREHRLPVLPDLGFVAVPVGLGRGALTRAAEGTRFHGDLAVVARGVASSRGASIPLVATLDHRGVRLEARIPALAAGCAAIALVPGAGAQVLSLESAAARGLAVLRAPDVPAPARLRIDLRVQDARAFLLEGDGEPVRRGVAELGYFGPGGAHC